jgi:hypothetical protein
MPKNPDLLRTPRRCRSLQPAHSRWADARHGHYSSTAIITLRQRLDLIGHRFNSLIELPPVTGKISDDAYHPW